MGSTWVDFMGASVSRGGNRYQGRYAEAGSGTPVILLHGQGAHIETFAKNIVPLGRSFHVYALDAAWHGYGPQPSFDESLFPTLVDQVIDFMDWRDIGSCFLEGQSMGAWIAMRVALDHPDRVKGMVLTTAQGFRAEARDNDAAIEPAPGPGARDRLINLLKNPERSGIRDRMKELLARPELLPEELVDIRLKLYQDPVISDSLQKVVASYAGGPESKAWAYALTEADLAKIETPSLVYWGDKNLLPPAVGQRLAASLPNANFYCASETGHWAQFEHSEEHNQLVTEFLLGLE